MSDIEELINGINLDSIGFPRTYVLDDTIPVPEPDFLAWAVWLEAAGDDRVVARTDVFPEAPDSIVVSTVFLGLDHNYYDGGPPLLFETLVFGGPLDGEMDRYPTWELAEDGHKRVLEKVRESGPYPDPF